MLEQLKCCRSAFPSKKVSSGFSLPLFKCGLVGGHFWRMQCGFVVAFSSNRRALLSFPTFSPPILFLSYFFSSYSFPFLLFTHLCAGVILFWLLGSVSDTETGLSSIC